MSYYQYQGTSQPTYTNDAAGQYHPYQPQQPPKRHVTRKSGTIKSQDWESDNTNGHAAESSRSRKEELSISPKAASSAIQRFLALQIMEQGFERAEVAAMVRFETEVVACASRVL